MQGTKSSSFEFATLLQYSPKGTSQICEQSRNVVDRLKKGRLEGFQTPITEIIQAYAGELLPFLDYTTTLVPVPRSHPLREDHLWPANSLCHLLAEITNAHVQPSLYRSTAVKKSQLYTKAEDRPSVHTHMATMAVGTIPGTTNITLVDDVLTRGRTTLAAALLMQKARPDAQIRVFALVRTQGGWAADITEIRSPRIGRLQQAGNDCLINYERTISKENK